MKTPLDFKTFSRLGRSSTALRKGATRLSTKALFPLSTLSQIGVDFIQHARSPSSHATHPQSGIEIEETVTRGDSVMPLT